MIEPVSTVKTIYEAFARGDVPLILQHVADDVAWELWADNTAQRLGVPWLLPRRGKAGVAEFFQYVGTEMRILDFQVLALMAGSKQVAAEFVIEASIPSTGGHYRDEEIHLWTFNDDGKVTRLRHYTDTAKHLHAAGIAWNSVT